MTYTSPYTQLVQLFTASVQRFGSRQLFGTRKTAGWHWTSYSEFSELVQRARGGLVDLGIGPGDRVAVISNNRLEWAVCAYGVFTNAATYVPMYEAQLDRDWQYILRDSGAKVCLVANAAIAGRVRALQPDLPELRHIIDFQDTSYTQLLERGAKHPAPLRTPSPNDCAMYIYTSGTTGNPKGVELTHHNLASNACGVLEVAPLDSRLQERSLAFLPWAHVFGGCVEINSLMAHGDSLAICDNTDKLLDYLPEVQPTVLFAVPRIWNRIYDGVQKQIAGRPKPIQHLFHTAMAAKSKQRNNVALGFGERIALRLAEKLIFSKVRARFGGRLRFAFSGAAALSRDVAEFIDNLGILVYEGYGLTESSGCTTASGPDRRLGSVGKPIPGVRVEIDKHAPGASANDGEIIIFGSGVMARYHNNPGDTLASFTPEGGLRSGDLGRIDADGFLYITGRVKELYKLSNGKYVAPAPLEEQLQLSPYIAQCVLYGADKPHNVALIVPDMQALSSWADGQGIDHSTLLTDPRTKELIRREIDAQSREIKGYEAVRDFILVPEPFTTQNDMLTPTMKLKRRNVMKQFGDKLEALYR